MNSENWLKNNVNSWEKEYGRGMVINYIDSI